MSRKNRSKERRPVVSGFILLGIGIFLWLNNMDALEYTWPIFIIIVGIALIAGSFVNRRNNNDTSAQQPPGASPPPPPPPPPPTPRA